MSSLDLVREHFDRAPRRFDAIYETHKPLHQRVVDRLFRRVVVERFHLIRNLAPSPGPRWTSVVGQDGTRSPYRALALCVCWEWMCRRQ